MPAGFSGWKRLSGVWVLAVALICLAGSIRGRCSPGTVSLLDLTSKIPLAVTFEPESMSLCSHSRSIYCEVLQPIVTIDHHWCLPALTLAATWCLLSKSRQ